MIRQFLFIIAICLSNLAYCHDLDLTVIKVLLNGNKKRVEVTTPLSRFVRSNGLASSPTGADLDQAVRAKLQPNQYSSADLAVRSDSDLLSWSANLEGNVEVQPMRFDTSNASARTIVATYKDGKLISERVLHEEKSVPSIIGIVILGVKHITSGLDHILFVFGLALVAGGWRSILKVLTAFTVAHSLTLMVAAMGWVTGNPRIVEPLIALSIIALAIESLTAKPDSESKRSWIRVAIAFGFGLVHGFGFAGGLSELGLRGIDLIKNLFMFSVGIEIGQVLILVPCFVTIAMVARLAQHQSHRFKVAASVALGMVGSFWFVERLI